jgi:ferredoxin
MDECPVEAIYPDMDVPEELQEWIELNEQADQHPQILGQKDPLKGPKCSNPNADQ